MQLGLPFEASTRPTAVDSIAPVRDRSNAPAPQPVPPVIAGSIAPIYFVRHRRARRYLLRVDLDGRLRVTIPRGGSQREGDAFARRHLAWVLRQRAVLSRVGFSAEDRQQMRGRAAMELPARLRELASLHGLLVTRVSIRNQRTRWGSCGRDGHLCLNWRLAAMPDWVRDYVMLHELMHLRRLDHSPAFWRLVAVACPRYREARQWLRAHGPELR